MAMADETAATVSMWPKVKGVVLADMWEVLGAWKCGAEVGRM
jgi:hypothetical protein